MAAQLDSTHAVNLRRLLGVRALLLGALLPLLIAAAGALGIALPLTALAIVIALVMALTALSWWRLERGDTLLERRAIVVQLGIDVAALTVILYLTGGWTNPLISLYLVPIAVAAASLSPALTWACAAVCVLAYSGLTRFYLPLFHMHGASDGGFSLHVTGMWLTFVLAAALVAYFGTSLAATLRERERALMAAREQNLRNEQILGVATLAAGTAHELSTPLASIAVIASELERSTEGETREDLRVLLQQVDTCRDALTRLRDAAAPAPERQRADRLLLELCDRFDLLRPTARLKCELDTSTPAPQIEVDNALRQALLNLLDNAADVSPRNVELRGRWGSERVEIDVLDRGPGFSGAGSGAGSGMGIGLLLANTSIERAGGTVHAAPRHGGGTRIRVSLPAAMPEAAIP